MLVWLSKVENKSILCSQRQGVLQGKVSSYVFVTFTALPYKNEVGATKDFKLCFSCEFLHCLVCKYSANFFLVCSTITVLILINSSINSS